MMFYSNKAEMFHDPIAAKRMATNAKLVMNIMKNNNSHSVLRRNV